jgi:glucose-1-phosphate thymidylyltransferase
VFDAADSGRLARIEEKPTQPGSSYAVTGFYIYDGQVFDFIRTLKPSGRGELEITDVNNCYLGQGQLAWAELGGYWLDAGTSFDSLFRANKTIAEERQRAGS